MHKFISFNLRIFPFDTAFLSAVSAAALYGKGIFTTIAIHDSTAFLWEKHWQRLIANAQKIGLDLTAFPEKSVAESLRAVIKENAFTFGRARLTFFDDAPSRIWNTDAKRRTSLLIQTGELRLSPANFRLTISPFQINSTSPLAGVKSCSYLENILAYDEAKRRGFDEAIRVNENGEIASACLANVFWVKREKIYTPPLETGCLPGTTRSFFLENFTIHERKAKFLELTQADEIFLTSSGIGVVNGVLERSPA